MGMVGMVVQTTILSQDGDGRPRRGFAAISSLNVFVDAVALGAVTLRMSSTNLATITTVNRATPRVSLELCSTAMEARWKKQERPTTNAWAIVLCLQ